jgi:hypothetical protein
MGEVAANASALLDLCAIEVNGRHLGVIHDALDFASAFLVSHLVS